ncbi:histidine phosphatase family protein [Moellerella wisconsensis]|uniref:ATP/GTP-binding transmembrane protein n=1 Tax=Moellerella wisconsensis ATCC 35017 TaxID=1354267 RepID=A0A0N0Z9L2_9GAMM|nr:histidine phosphatase family protein [Moellerella wisconsensis]KPD02374.1 ATP/GTP-binding transmembrane protein [Moellerella wisconsensis ATCC 35017]VFS54036.1 Uncharacterised protein [Moellerella wisconsensis]
MGKLFIILNLVIASLGQMAYSSQTIVFIRHGEKPDNDSGQLTCKGLNRSLALPDILINKYGIPQAIYAAAPKQNKLGHSLRALQTISPTAIRLSLPINLKYHAKETKELQRSLLNDKYADSVIFVAWEHDNLVKTAKAIMEQLGGDSEQVPKWKGDDFDSIYVIRIERTSNNETHVSFMREQQNLTHLSTICPK